MSSSTVIASVLVANKCEWAIQFPIQLQYRVRTIATTALIDCGATGNFINPSLMQHLLLPSWPIPPLQAFNVNGTTNKQGQITATTQVHCKTTTFEEDLTLMIIGLGWAQIVLGMPWLMKNNPHIDWVKRTISLDDKHIRKTTLSTELTITTKKDEVALPPQYTNYTNMFSKQTFDILPPWRDFDHAVNLKELFTPKVAKLYLLNLQELDVCREFIEENLKMGRIQPSKSPQASLFCFVKKKDGKLWPVQDNRYLNEHTIKNAYPLPLITDLINNLWQFSHFTKLMYAGGTVQYHSHQGRWQMGSHIYHSSRVVWTHSDVLQPLWIPSNLSSIPEFQFRSLH